MQKPATLPPTMKALVLEKFGEPLRLAEIPVPKPGPGEVLVKMAASPINPSDLSAFEGTYGQLRTLPSPMGMEGSGQVVAAGSGFYPRFLPGRRVACFADPKGQGLWAEYLVTKASLCIPLRKEISFKQGAMLLVNPLTAWAFFDIARRRRLSAMVNTAAASALGRMVIRLGGKFGVEVVNIVRRKEQVDLLRGLGAGHVLNSSDTTFSEELKTICHQLNIKLALDAVAGELTLTLLDALPAGGEVVVYGALSEEPCLADPRSMIFENKRITGFWLSSWIGNKNPLQILRISQAIQKNMDHSLQSEVARILSLEEGVQGPELYRQNMTAGKILIDMGNFELV